MQRLLAVLFAMQVAYAAPKAQFIRVDTGVELEVLDWGGQGRSIVLLAGYLTAHAYEPLAQKLSALGHVYAITRRGLGASTHTESGFEAARSARDVIEVLAALHLPQLPVLAGHSFGGQDIGVIAASYPDRIAGIVYLNSVEDPTLKPSDFGVDPPDGKLLPSSLRSPNQPDLSSISAYQKWQLQTHGIEFPESELRQLYEIRSDGSLGKYRLPKATNQGLFKGLAKPEYDRIKVPVLALFASQPSLAALIEKYKPQTEQERGALKQKFDFDQAMQDRYRRDLLKGIPSARIVVIPGANFYIFISSTTEIVREMKLFLESL
ncbi:MAG: alpha/beta hydrolase [Acidobacteria bacterium]|nr:alpha/beta hydrolase [Acidobacteriota bacterium]